MDLDDYKIISRSSKEAFLPKEVSELTDYIRGRTSSIVGKIERNLKLEIIFALLFLIFACCMLVLFSDIFFLRIFTFLLIVFSVCFIYYVVKLLRYIRVQYALDISVDEQLSKYVFIISKFTRLYFQLTMVMVPVIFFLALIAGYLDRAQSGNFIILIYSETIWIYLGLSVTWCVVMYYVTAWYIKKLYGNHLNKLKQQLRDLRQVE